jgi:hypothetical protein
MLKVTIRTPANTLNEIFAQETTVFQTTRGPIEAQSLQDQVSFPDATDSIQYLAYCCHGTWFTVVQKESI